MWENMIETITAVNHAVNQFIWGVPAMGIAGAALATGIGQLLSL